MKSKHNYIFEAIDTYKIVIDKPKINPNWQDKFLKGKGKISRKARKEKKRKERQYNRIPKHYKVYIKSKWWTKRKNEYYRKHKKQCQACFTTKYINLHHIVYKNFGYEADEDLVALCVDCHGEFHEKYGVSATMKSETNMFIIEKQQEIQFPKF